jgi:glycosyltransferase involved in cell wall biosynthesis
MIDVSIIIPFKNQIEQLEKLIEGILKQKTDYTFEIIILDSSDIINEKYIVKLHESIKYVRIPPITFNHGHTRNLGVEKSEGKVLIFTVQDAVPCDENWINQLTRPIFDNIVDAISGGQKPKPSANTNPVEWYRPIDKPSLKVINIESKHFIKLSSLDKSKYIYWDNVNSAYSRNAIIKIPFREMMFGEDAQWAVDAIINGVTIGYTGLPMVYHYHPYSFDFNIKRTLAEYYTRKLTINLNPVEPKLKLRIVISWIKRIIQATKNPFSIIFWLIYNFKIFKTYKKAYKIWKENGYAKIEEFLLKNVPMSVHGK